MLGSILQVRDVSVNQKKQKLSYAGLWQNLDINLKKQNNRSLLWHIFAHPKQAPGAKVRV